jgi:regulatory protein
MWTRARRSTSEPADAHELALRLLRARDWSAAELARRLEERGVSADAVGTTVAALVRTGIVDDSRHARGRAAALAERGSGDTLIRHRLRELGIPAELVDEAIAELEPEDERAARIVARRGPGSRTARYLTGKGFSEETVHRLVATESTGELG